MPLPEVSQAAGRLRFLALALFAAVLSILPVALYIESVPEPSTGTLWAMLAALLVAPMSLLLLVLLTRRVVNRAEPSAQLRRRLHFMTLFLGPLGCVWVIFRLTRDLPDPAC